jgi:hypothetical protein
VRQTRGQGDWWDKQPQLYSRLRWLQDQGDEPCACACPRSVRTRTRITMGATSQHRQQERSNYPLFTTHVLEWLPDTPGAPRRAGVRGAEGFFASRLHTTRVEMWKCVWAG